jgi:hypothetical protein
MGMGLLLVVLAAAAASAQSLCSYRSPESSMVEARLTFAYRYYDDAATPIVDVNSGRLAVAYDQLFDSPNSGFTLVGAADLALSGFVPTAWLGQGALTYRLYPWSEGVFFLFGGLEAAASTGLPQPGLDARAGLGLGRFTDVTPLAKAKRIGAALVSLGAIPSGLSGDVVLAVAGMIGRAGEYPSPRELVADIEAIVEFDAGVQLDARALLTIEDLVLSTGMERRCGWTVQAGVGYELLDPYGGAQSAVFASSADTAFASSPSDQFLFHVSFSGPFDLLDENSLVGSASYVVDLGKGQAVTTGYKLSRIKPSGVPATTTHQASLGLVFSLSRGSLGLQASVSHRTGEPGWSIDVSMSAALELL